MLFNLKILTNTLVQKEIQTRFDIVPSTYLYAMRFGNFGAEEKICSKWVDEMKFSRLLWFLCSKYKPFCLVSGGNFYLDERKKNTPTKDLSLFSCLFERPLHWRRVYTAMSVEKDALGGMFIKLNHCVKIFQ